MLRRCISLYSCKIVDKKEILCIVSNIGIYCSSDKVGTVYLVQYIFENPKVNINALCNYCKYMACCSSEYIFKLLYEGDKTHLSQHYYNVTTNSHNGQLTLRTYSQAPDSGAVRWTEGQHLT